MTFEPSHAVVSPMTIASFRYAQMPNSNASEMCKDLTEVRG